MLVPIKLRHSRSLHWLASPRLQATLNSLTSIIEMYRVMINLIVIEMRSKKNSKFVRNVSEEIVEFFGKSQQKFHSQKGQFNELKIGSI